LYTIWMQTNPPPTMNLFDAPTRSYCVVRREQTATPLQALALFNDPQFVEAARVLAQRSIKKHPDDLNARWRGMFLACASRTPTDKQLELLTKIYNQQLNYFSTDAQRADQFVHVGETPPDDNLWSPDVAATAMVASAILDLDECGRKP